MHWMKKLVFAIPFALVLLPVRVALAADDLERVLRKLDAAAADFHSTSAEFEFDSVQTEPVPDKDVQTGVVYYERKGKDFQMAAHIREVNGKPAPKIYTYSGGTFRLFEPGVNQLTTYGKAGKFESYVMLGFGASGKDLADKWDVTYVKSEALLDGKTSVKTEVLELVAKDPTVRKNIPKVTIWVDPERAVSLKQVFDEGHGQYRVSVYFNIKTNQPLPADAFTIKTDSKTNLINQ
jgi:outer membrane lipoprotein-sorting protein